jgi:uncharacterized protein
VLSRRKFLLGCASMVAVGAPVGWYGGVYEPNDIELVRRTVTVRKLPARLHGIRAVQISDLHAHQVTDLHLQMLRQIQTLKPDLLLVTGDLVDDKSAVVDVVELLTNIKPALGTWVVPGNWDHAANAIDDLSADLESTHARLLVNEAAAVEDGFWIVGVDDPASSQDDLIGAMRAVPSNAARILLAHSPDITRVIDETTPFGLITVGHTHGGQINLPGLSGGWLHNGPSKRFIRGLYDIHGSPMYVNRGIGTTTIPIRIGSRPEITEFTLHAA